MKKPPAVILLISSIILFNLLFQIGFDVTAFQLLADNPMKSIQLVLPFILVIGLLTRQVWAWYFTAIISGFRIMSSIALFLLSLPNTSLGIVYILSYHSIVLGLLFRTDVSAFYNFEKSTTDQRIKQVMKYIC